MEITAAINPLKQSESNGVDMYLDTVGFFLSLVHEGHDVTPRGYS